MRQIVIDSGGGVARIIDDDDGVARQIVVVINEVGRAETWPLYRLTLLPPH